jgi:hypothetical protein
VPFVSVPQNTSIVVLLLHSSEHIHPAHDGPLRLPPSLFCRLRSLALSFVVEFAILRVSPGDVVCAMNESLLRWPAARCRLDSVWVYFSGLTTAKRVI